MIPAADGRDRAQIRGLLEAARGISSPQAAMAIFCGRYAEADRVLRALEADLPRAMQEAQQAADEEWARRGDDYAMHAKAMGQERGVDVTAHFERLAGKLKSRRQLEAMGLWLSPAAMNQEEDLLACLAQQGGILARISWFEGDAAREEMIALGKVEGPPGNRRFHALAPSLPQQTWLSMAELEDLDASFMIVSRDVERLQRWLKS